MKFSKTIFIMALLSCIAITQAAESLEIGIREPDKKVDSVEYYSFCPIRLINSKTGQASDQRPRATKYFTFEDEGSTYSLKFSEPSNYITKGTYYIKTFGGMAPTVSIHVIANRFIAFPETIRGSELYETAIKFNPMKAITHVYDIKIGATVLKSEPYIYDHDVPLVYDLAVLMRLLQSK